MIKETEDLTDNELFIRVTQNNTAAYNEFRTRYKNRIHQIFNKNFDGIKNKLSYNITQLNEDVESAVWGKLFTKKLEDLQFDSKGSIGGLIHSIAEAHVLDMLEKTNNHRSSQSTAQRKVLLKEDRRDEIKINHEFSSLNNEKEIDDNEMINLENINMSEQIVSNKYNELSSLQKQILHLKKNGLSNKDIALSIELTVDKVRTQLKQIKKISSEASEELYN